MRLGSRSTCWSDGIVIEEGSDLSALRLHSIGAGMVGERLRMNGPRQGNSVRSVF